MEPRLTDTPQQWTPIIKWTILKVPNVSPETSIHKKPLTNEHLRNRQFSHTH